MWVEDIYASKCKVTHVSFLSDALKREPKKAKHPDTKMQYTTTHEGTERERALTDWVEETNPSLALVMEKWKRMDKEST